MEIELCDYKVQIDEEDYDKVTALRWHPEIAIMQKSGTLYFRRNETDHITGKRYGVTLHRFIMGCRRYDSMVVDHINGNTLDNRKQNLRVCTVSENARNSKVPITNTTGYKGVYYAKDYNKYRAAIRTDHGKKALGTFDTPEEAYEAYCEASKKYHGEFGRTK